MQTVYSKTALKFLAKLEKKQRDRIRTAIKGLTVTPPQGDIKLMQGVQRHIPFAGRFLQSDIQIRG